MAKQARQHKVSDKNGITLEHNTIYDDTLLPNADELAKLNNVSSEIVPWIMKRTEIEQDARIEFNKERLNVTKREMKHIRTYNLLALSMAFLITLAFLALSFYLIYIGKETTGTIFAGGTIIAIVFYFLQRDKSEKI